MAVLGADDVRAWRLRVPQLVIAWALPLTAALLIALHWDDPFDDETIQDVISVAIMANYVVTCLFALSMALGWLRPRLGLWVLTGCLLLLAPSTRTLDEFAIGAFWLGLFAIDMYLMRRQTSLARGWPRLEHRALIPEPTMSLHRHAPWKSWVVSGVALSLALGLAGLWLFERDRLADLDARAESRTVEVTELDTTFDFIEFRVDGTTHETQVYDAADYEVGESITVRVDPAGSFGPLGPEDYDPHWTLFWGPLFAPLLLVAILVWATPRLRHHDRKRAFIDSRPVRALVRPVRRGADRSFTSIELQAGDGMTFAFAPRVTTYYDMTQTEASTSAPDDDAVHEAWVYGLTRFGRTAVIEVPDLRILLVPTSPLRDPFTLRAALRRVFHRG